MPFKRFFSPFATLATLATFAATATLATALAGCVAPAGTIDDVDPATSQDALTSFGTASAGFDWITFDGKATFRAKNLDPSSSPPGQVNVVAIDKAKTKQLETSATLVKFDKTTGIGTYQGSLTGICDSVAEVGKYPKGTCSYYFAGATPCTTPPTLVVKPELATTLRPLTMAPIPRLCVRTPMITTLIAH